MSHRRLAVLASLSVLMACGSDSGTNPITAVTSGSVSFSYTGGGGGSYNASGGISSATLAATPFTTTWAAGYKDATDNSTNIASNIPRTGTTSDLVVITIKGQTASTGTIAVGCVPTSTVACNSVSLLIGQSSSGATFSNICSLESGSITLASISSTNATGSFSGSGTCVSSAGATSAWVVLNGAFNVPLLPNVPSNLP